jgi:HTH-type transcriptional regulator/antitoxin HigA
MNRVPSPGELLRDVLEQRGWSQSKLALLCGVSMTTINRVISNRRGITPQLDAQLSRVLGSEPGYWLACNQRYRRSLGVRTSSWPRSGDRSFEAFG